MEDAQVMSPMFLSK